MDKFLSSETLDQVRAEVQGRHTAQGEQFNINHCMCPAGVDTKERLYVKVTDDGNMILAYCHHCGGKGYIKVGGKYSPKIAGTATGSLRMGLIAEKQNLFKALLGEYNSASPLNSREGTCRYHKVLEWIKEVDTLEALDRYNFFDMRSNPYRVLIPFFSEDNIVRIDTRDFVYDGKGPKWMRRIMVSDSGVPQCNNLVVFNPTGSKTGVVCEDPFSAMKIACAGYAGICLSGSEITTDEVLKLSGMFDKFLIWLDNDSKTINEKAKKIQDKFLLFNDVVWRLDRVTDPKHYSIPSIKTLVDIYTGETT